MPRAKKNKEKLSIYLAKNDHASDIEFVKVENSIAPKTVKLPTGSATLYIKKEVDPHPPQMGKFPLQGSRILTRNFWTGKYRRRAISNSSSWENILSSFWLRLSLDNIRQH